MFRCSQVGRGFCLNLKQLSQEDAKTKIPSKTPSDPHKPETMLVTDNED